MKIALTCPASLPATQFGGILFLCVDIARELSKKNHEITIYTTDLDFGNNVNYFNANLPREEKKNGFIIKRSHVYFKIKLFFVNPGIYKQIKQDKPDIIHAVGIRSFQTLIAAILSKIHKIPLVISDQGGLFTHPDFKSGGLVSFLYKLQEPLIRFITNKASIIIVANEYEQEIFSKYCDKSKLIIVRNGINLETFEAVPFDFKQKYQIFGRIILFVGRFNKVKGVDLLIQAFSDFCKQKEFDDVVLVIMGADFGYQKEMINDIQKLKVQNRIKIIQKPPREDVIAAYHSCEFAVLPSRWEMSPLTPLEVFSCRKPVISSMVHGIPYVIEDGKNGILVNPENKGELVHAMISLLNNKELREKLGNEGFKLVERECNSKIMAEKIFQVYSSLLNDN